MARPAALPPPGSPRPPLADGAGRHRAPPGGGPGRGLPSPGTGATRQIDRRPGPRWDPGVFPLPVGGCRSTDRFPEAGKARTGSLWGGQGVPTGCRGSPDRCCSLVSVPGSSSRRQLLLRLPVLHPRCPHCPARFPGSSIPRGPAFPGHGHPRGPASQPPWSRAPPGIPGHPRAPGEGTCLLSAAWAVQGVGCRAACSSGRGAKQPPR